MEMQHDTQMFVIAEITNCKPPQYICFRSSGRLSRTTDPLKALRASSPQELSSELDRLGIELHVTNRHLTIEWRVE